jgi:cell wall assembly regulator SMI1
VKFSFSYVAIIAAAALGCSLHSAYPDPGFDENIRKFEADLKKDLPQRVDEITTLEDVRFENKKITYWYVIDTTRAKLDLHKLEQQVWAMLCSKTEIARAINERLLTYEYRYANEQRAHLTSFTFTTCPVYAM